MIGRIRVLRQATHSHVGGASFPGGGTARGPAGRSLRTPAVAAQWPTSADAEQLILSAAQGGDWMKAAQLLIGAVAVNMVPTTRAYDETLAAVARGAPWQLGARMLAALQTSRRSSLALTETLLRHRSRSRPEDFVPLLRGVRHQMALHRLRVSPALYVTCSRYLLDRGAWQPALAMMTDMADDGIPPSVPLGEVLLETAAQGQQWEMALVVLSMLHTGRVPVSDKMLSSLTRSFASPLARWDVALRVVLRETQASPSTPWPLLATTVDELLLLHNAADDRFRSLVLAVLDSCGSCPAPLPHAPATRTVKETRRVHVGEPAAAEAVTWDAALAALSVSGPHTAAAVEAAQLLPPSRWAAALALMALCPVTVPLLLSRAELPRAQWREVLRVVAESGALRNVDVMRAQALPVALLAAEATARGLVGYFTRGSETHRSCDGYEALEHVLGQLSQSLRSASLATLEVPVTPNTSFFRRAAGAHAACNAARSMLRVQRELRSGDWCAALAAVTEQTEGSDPPCDVREEDASAVAEFERRVNVAASAGPALVRQLWQLPPTQSGWLLSDNAEELLSKHVLQLGDRGAAAAVAVVLTHRPTQSAARSCGPFRESLGVFGEAVHGCPGAYCERLLQRLGEHTGEELWLPLGYALLGYARACARGPRVASSALWAWRLLREAIRKSSDAMPVVEQAVWTVFLHRDLVLLPGLLAAMVDSGAIDAEERDTFADFCARSVVRLLVSREAPGALMPVVVRCFRCSWGSAGATVALSVLRHHRATGCSIAASVVVGSLAAQMVPIPRRRVEDDLWGPLLQHLGTGGALRRGIAMACERLHADAVVSPMEVVGGFLAIAEGFSSLGRKEDALAVLLETAWLALGVQPFVTVEQALFAGSQGVLEERERRAAFRDAMQRSMHDKQCRGLPLAQILAEATIDHRSWDIALTFLSRNGGAALTAVDHRSWREMRGALTVAVAHSSWDAALRVWRAVSSSVELSPGDIRAVSQTDPALLSRVLERCAAGLVGGEAAVTCCRLLRDAVVIHGCQPTAEQLQLAVQAVGRDEVSQGDRRRCVAALREMTAVASEAAVVEQAIRILTARASAALRDEVDGDEPIVFLSEALRQPRPLEVPHRRGSGALGLLVTALDAGAGGGDCHAYLPPERPPLSHVELAELVEWAPLIVLGTMRQLEALASQTFGGRFRSFELKLVLGQYTDDVRRILHAPGRARARPDDAAGGSPVVGHLLHSALLPLLLSQLLDPATGAVDEAVLLADIQQRIFLGFADHDTVRLLWQRCAEKARSLRRGRWEPVVEAELVEAIRLQDGRLPLTLVTAPGAARREIAQYWATYGRVLAPQQYFSGFELCLVALYVPLLEPHLSAEPMGAAMRCGPVHDLCTEIKRAHFSDVGASEALLRTVHSVDDVRMVVRRAFPSLRQLYRDLDADRESHQYYYTMHLFETAQRRRDAAVSTVARGQGVPRWVLALRLLQHMHRCRRPSDADTSGADALLAQDTVSSLVRSAWLDARDGMLGTAWWVLSLRCLQSLVPPRAAAAQWRSALAALSARADGGGVAVWPAPAADRARPCIERIADASLRALVVVMWSCCQRGDAIPFAVSLQCVDIAKRAVLGSGGGDHGHRTDLADLVAMWQALQSLDCVTRMDPQHQQLLRRLLTRAGD